MGIYSLRNHWYDIWGTVFLQATNDYFYHVLAGIALSSSLLLRSHIASSSLQLIPTLWSNRVVNPNLAMRNLFLEKTPLLQNTRVFPFLIVSLSHSIYVHGDRCRCLYFAHDFCNGSPCSAQKRFRYCSIARGCFRWLLMMGAHVDSSVNIVANVEDRTDSNALYIHGDCMYSAWERVDDSPREKEQHTDVAGRWVSNNLWWLFHSSHSDTREDCALVQIVNELWDDSRNVAEGSVVEPVRVEMDRWAWETFCHCTEKAVHCRMRARAIVRRGSHSSRHCHCSPSF